MVAQGEPAALVVLEGEAALAVRDHPRRQVGGVRLVEQREADAADKPGMAARDQVPRVAVDPLIARFVALRRQ